MKLPDGVVVGGQPWKIEMVKELYGDNVAALGITYKIQRTVKIAKMQGVILTDKDEYFPVDESIQISTFFHELWHILCNELDEGELNTEQNACFYSLVCLQEMEGYSVVDYRNFQLRALSKMINQKLIELTKIQEKRFLWLIDGIKYYGDCE
jgi:hypothetical protein